MDIKRSEPAGGWMWLPYSAACETPKTLVEVLVDIGKG
jgi:hypothetical protein